MTPAPLAIERSHECDILPRQLFEHPILDVGCGDGLFSYCLFDEKLDTGIDPRTEELAHAQRYLGYEELIATTGD